MRLPGSSKVDPGERVHDFVRAQVCAGLLSPEVVLDEVTAAVDEELDSVDDPAAYASKVIEEARTDLATDEASWPDVTDYDRLQLVFDDLGTRGIVVLQGVPDHWSAAGELERRDDAGERVRGIAWFTAPDVWHAIDYGMLEVNLWHGDTANAAPGDQLLADVLEAFADQGLEAHFDEGRIEVSAHWQRRL